MGGWAGNKDSYSNEPEAARSLCEQSDPPFAEAAKDGQPQTLESTDESDAALGRIALELGGVVAWDDTICGAG
jgi:hypothetical protein